MAAYTIALSEINTNNGRFYLETRLKNEGKEGFTLTLLDGENVWEGVISEEYLDQQCEILKMDFDTYVKETRAAFTQEGIVDQNFECHFKPTANSSQFSWKKMPTHDIKYNLGLVDLRKCSSPASKICDVFSHCIAHVRALEGQVKSLETDNERLTNDRQKALKRLDKCVTAKEELEMDLYSKFVLVLNSKKERIRLLEEQLQTAESLDVSKVSIEDSGSLPTSRKTAADRHSVTVRKKNESASEDYDVGTEDDQESPPKKQKRPASHKTDEKEETFVKLSEDEEDSTMVPVARRPQRQRATKKQTPAIPTLPRVSCAGPSRERPGSAGRTSTLRKSGSGTSNKSSDPLDPDDLLEDF